MIDCLKVAEWREILRPPVRGHGAQESDGARHDPRDQETIVGNHGPVLCIEINLTVRFGQTLAAIVDALAVLPERIRRLGNLNCIARVIKVWTGSLDLLEIGLNLYYSILWFGATLPALGPVSQCTHPRSE